MQPADILSTHASGMTCFRRKTPSSGGGTPGQCMPMRQKAYRNAARNSAAPPAACSRLRTLTAAQDHCL